MATLYGECLVSFQKIMHDNMDSFTRKGFDLKFYNTKKEYSGGFSGLREFRHSPPAIPGISFKIA